MKASNFFNSKIIVFLTVTTIVIWSVIIYNIITYFLPSDDILDNSLLNGITTVNDNKSNGVETKDEIQFEKIDRDPFSLPKIETSQKVAKNVKSKPIPQIPLIIYKINGVVINDNNKLIILEDITNQYTAFLHEGEEYKNIKIKIISDTKITLMEDKEQKEIFLNSR